MRTITIFLISIISLSSFSQIKTVLDPVTLDKIQDWKIPPEIVLKRQGYTVPNGIVVQIEDVRYVFSPSTWAQLETIIKDKMTTEINRLIATAPAQAARQANIDAMKAKIRAAEVKKKADAETEINRIDNLPSDEIP